jgi:ATP-binding cassette subfamily F protein uup
VTLITLQGATLAYGDRPLLDNADLTLLEGERIGLIGRNGAGKSSLMRVLARLEYLEDGEMKQQDGLSVVYVEQEPVFPEGSGALDSLMRRIGAYEHHDEREMWQIQSRILEYLHRFGLEENALDLSSASGGEKKKAALAAAFAVQPDVLFLDEPTNHLDIDAILVLEDLILSEFRGSKSLMTVTHDRSFLNRVSTRILELDRGILRSYPGSFDAYEKRKDEELHAEEIARRQFDKFWAQEEVWIRKGIEARRTRNEGRVRRLMDLRRQREERRDRVGVSKLSLDSGERSGKLVAELENVYKSFDGEPVVRDLSLRILRGDKLGILGPNGAGKTTLVKLILGELAPDAGKIRLGTNLQIAYFDQLRETLDPEKTLAETVSPGSDWVEIRGVRKHVIGYLEDFLFPPHRSNVKVASLSGGERNRLLLAKLFARPANLLVMDEPTNDLDIESLELLEETLSEYPGTVILVSHDRSFMDNVATIFIGAAGDGVWKPYLGGYEEWLKDRREARKKEEPQVQTPAAPKAAPKKRNSNKDKLTFKERKELEELPSLIEKLEEEKDALVQAMQDAAYQKKSPEEMLEDGQRMKEVEETLEEKYARWEFLAQKEEGAGS